MPDLPDINTPLPDLAHESLRRSAVAALDNLELQLQRLDRVFLLLLGTGQGMQGTLNVVQSGQAAIGQLQTALTQQAQTVTAQAAQIADLTARVAALEPPTTPTGGST